MRECDFCDEFSSGKQNAYARVYGPHATSRVLVDGFFRLLPTLGQITEGHLLISPAQHLCALADLADEQTQQLESLCLKVKSVLRRAYGACVFFEHGVRGVGSGGCGIDHAHMHAVPAEADGVLNILMERFNGGRVGSLGEVNRRVSRDSSYLFFEHVSGQRYVFPVDNLPSQYMRKLVADSIGKTDWDWRECGREPELVSTVRRLSPLLSPPAAGHRG